MIDDLPYEQRAPQKAKALAFITAALSAGKNFPTNEQIAAHMGWKNPSSAEDCKISLAADGKLMSERKYVRSRVVRRFWLPSGRSA